MTIITDTAAPFSIRSLQTANLNQPLEISLSETAITIAGKGYTLIAARQQPLVDLYLNGRHVATLNVASGLDTVEAFDSQTELAAPVLQQENQNIALLTWRGKSAVWQSKQIELHAWADGFMYGYSVQGRGVIDRAHLWRNFSHGSTAHSVRLFNPEPNSGLVHYSGQHCETGKQCVMCFPDQPWRAAKGLETLPVPAIPNDFMTISVGRDKEYHDGNWFFTPSPFCYAVEGAGNWLSLGIAAKPGAWNFSDMLFPGGDFGFSLVYDGHEKVDGVWQSPRLLCLTAGDEYNAVERYIAALRAMELVPNHGRSQPHKWWREPIFCGWGEQVSREVHEKTSNAFARATQTNYEEWLNTLESHDLNPGIVVIDDKWQKHYGLNDIDTTKWPDMRGFVAEQHRKGRHVLLWLKAWAAEGVPADECILDAAGTPVTVDPGNPRFRRRFAEQVREMLQDIGADGFKIDFTHLSPRGLNAEHAEALQQRNAQTAKPAEWLAERPPLTASTGGSWGLELLRQWLAIITAAVTIAKPDALIITHTANPYLADLVDMLRLNDVAGREDIEASIVPDMQHRARIARLASPFWLLDADNWPCSSRQQWREYITAQASGELGIPSLYHAARLAWGRTDIALDAADYALIRTTWAKYRQLQETKP